MAKEYIPPYVSEEEEGLALMQQGDLEPHFTSETFSSFDPELSNLFKEGIGEDTTAEHGNTCNKGDWSQDIPYDDDLMEIDPTDASECARRRWSSKVIVIDDDVEIKNEPASDDVINLTDDSPDASFDPKSIMAAQQSLLNGAAHLGSKPMGCSGRNQSRPGVGIPLKYEPTTGSNFDRAKIEVEIGVPTIDLSWNDDLDEVDDEYERSRRLQILLHKKAAHKLTQAENQEFLQLQRKLQQQTKGSLGVEQGHETHGDDGIFLPETKPPFQGDRDFDSRITLGSLKVESDEDNETKQDICSADDDEEYIRRFGKFMGEGENEQRKGPKPKTPIATDQRKRLPKNAREYSQREQEKRLEKGQNCKRKKVPAATAQQQKNFKVEKNVKGGSRSKQLSKATIKALGGFLHSNPIQDRLDVGYHPEPVTSGEKNKEKLLNEIIRKTSQDRGRRPREIGQERQAILKASRSFGYGRVKVDENGHWLLDGMKSGLYNHQLLGASFMVLRELSATTPKGGINADGMGLGKTLQLLATIVANPPPKEYRDRDQKSTLIVAPAAIIYQWLSEIRLHVEKRRLPRILRYKRSYKLSERTILDHDIVITTYAEVMNSFPFPDDEKQFEKLLEGDPDYYPTGYEEDIGDLHKITWYRIVLDEAHAMKNYQSRTSIACQRLKGKYRWCLTGTPILNRLEEFYPYIRFLRIERTQTFQVFKSWFCNAENEEDVSRLVALLNGCMIRRNMRTMLLGRPVVSLPDPHPEVLWIKFSREERIIYDITEKRVREQLGQWFAGPGSKATFINEWVYVLRLRQCASHPLLLEETIKRFWTAADRAEFHRQCKRYRRDKTPLYKQCELWVNEAEHDAEPAPFGISSFGSICDIDKYIIRDGSTKTALNNTICKLCSRAVREPYTTDCGHVFCKRCIDDYMKRKAKEDPTFIECPVCDAFIHSVGPHAAMQSEDETGGNKNASTRSNNYKKHGQDVLGYEPTLEKFPEWLSKIDESKQLSLFASAKTTALKATILKWFDEAPNDKIIVYTQFKLLSMIVGRIAKAEGWSFLYYSGDMSETMRVKAVELFHSENGPRIMISGLKCGGLGLNLTAANRCISLDLWWNHPVEQQAFGRIFRLGQKKETYLTRFCVRHTIEERMLEMQAEKIVAIEKMMEEGKLPKNSPLTAMDMARLVGKVVHNSEGNIVIESDFSDDESEDDLYDDE